jgi:ABC-2 type transport system ATP-binding protein
MPTAIEAIDLAKRFRGVDAVNGLNLQVQAGSIFALVGPNGAGKTTTLKLLLNLLRPTRGRAAVLGTDTRRLGPRELARIGYVSENQQLPDWMTAGQWLAYVRPFYPTWDDALCRKLHTDMAIDMRKPLRALSRGTRMKAALVASLAYRPALIVLDEPFTGLDPLVRDELIGALVELTAECRWTTLVSSHDIDEVERLADTIAFIDNGHIVFTESVQALINEHRVPLRDIFVTLARRSRERAAASEAR